MIYPSRVLVVLFALTQITYSQVGIGTEAPTNTLDVNGDVRVRNLYNFESIDENDKVVVADADGVLKTAPKREAFLVGADFTGNIPANGGSVLVQASAGNKQAVALGDYEIEIEQTSLVNISYRVSYELHPTTMQDGRLKRVTSYFRFRETDDPAISTSRQFGIVGVPVNLANNGSNYQGWYYNSTASSIILKPGKYTIRLVGEVHNSWVASQTFQVTFGSDTTDLITVTALPVR